MFRIFSSAEPGPQLTWTAMVVDNSCEVIYSAPATALPTSDVVQGAVCPECGLSL